MIRLDTALITFCDSSGISVFCQARKLAAAQNTTLYLASARPSLRRLLLLAGTTHLLQPSPAPGTTDRAGNGTNPPLGTHR